MAKTKQLNFRCDVAHVSPNSHRTVEVEAGDPNMDDLFESIDREDVVDYVGQNFNPDDVFSETQLEKWAEANGYVKGDQA